jgi:hypothetical protein
MSSTSPSVRRPRPREGVRVDVDEALRGRAERRRPVLGANQSPVHVPGEFAPAFEAFGPPLAPPRRHRPDDAVGEEGVRLPSGFLLDVVRRPLGDGPRGDGLAPLAGEQYHRQVRPPLADAAQHVQSRHLRHPVVGDEAVDRLRFEAVQPRLRHRLDAHRESLVLAFEELRGHRRELPVVVDEEDPNVVRHHCT